MTRAAVVLFVESDHDGDEVDTAYLVNIALQEARHNGLKCTLHGTEYNIKVVSVMEAGLAVGNRYLYTEVTDKAWRDRGLL